MNKYLKISAFYFLAIPAFIIWGCSSQPVTFNEGVNVPSIEPDYINVTIPPAIAPLNFIIHEDGSKFLITATSTNGKSLKIKSSDGKVCFPLNSWKRLLKGAGGGNISIVIDSFDPAEGSRRFKPFRFNISGEDADPWLVYRLLYPGYETYLDLKIIQRDITGFREKTVVDNSLLKSNCINCHSFRQNDPGTFMFHVRGKLGGTYFVSGEKVTRRDLKTTDMTSGAVYPAWNPNGRFVAFSSNNIVQSFHAVPGKNIEVTDLSSSLVVYDITKNEMIPVTGNDTAAYMETFPEWAADGKFIYYCRARQYKEGDDIERIRYDLVRRSFDEPGRKFGEPELIFDAVSLNKSVSFPRVSPDGRFLVFTLHNYGNFSIWHSEADLYLMDLNTGKASKMNLNSDRTESWHCWSSNGKWLVFSSKRDDGLTARPYFSYIDNKGEASKPFVLPQKDPALYSEFVKTFNRPEFIKGMIKPNPRVFEKASGELPVKAESPAGSN